MESRRIPSFTEVATNFDGDNARKFFLEAARQMIAEGKKEDRIKLALIEAAIELAEEGPGYVGWLRGVNEYTRERLVLAVDSFFLEKEEARRRSEN